MEILKNIGTAGLLLLATGRSIADSAQPKLNGLDLLLFRRCWEVGRL
jgi:hypothetical protein